MGRYEELPQIEGRCGEHGLLGLLSGSSGLLPGSGLLLLRGEQASGSHLHVRGVREVIEGKGFVKHGFLLKDEGGIGIAGGAGTDRGLGNGLCRRRRRGSGRVGAEEGAVRGRGGGVECSSKGGEDGGKGGGEGRRQDRGRGVKVIAGRRGATEDLLGGSKLDLFGDGGRGEALEGTQGAGGQGQETPGGEGAGGGSRGCEVRRGEVTRSLGGIGGDADEKGRGQCIGHMKSVRWVVLNVKSLFQLVTPRRREKLWEGLFYVCQGAYPIWGGLVGWLLAPGRIFSIVIFITRIFIAMNIISMNILVVIYPQAL